jgi:predicted kinase
MEYSRSNSTPIVCPDAVRLALHGQAFIQSAEAFVWATVHTMIRALFLAGHKAIIIDACNISRKRRDAWKYREYQDCEVEFVEFRTPQSVCESRAVWAGREDLLPIIERMATNRAPIAPDEGKVTSAFD